MANLSEVEAAIHTEFSVELLDALTKKCPKSGETRKLNYQINHDRKEYDAAELDFYKKYLAKPWPVTENSSRPHIPTCIKDDVKLEAGFHCAICETADACEFAHIDDVAHSKNNSPDNLIYLCAKHHSQYDAPKACITRSEILCAKKMLRNRRIRFLKSEDDVQKFLLSALSEAKKLKDSAANSQVSKDVYVNALNNIVKEVKEKISAINNGSVSSCLLNPIVRDLKDASKGSDLNQWNSIVDKFDKVVDDSDNITCPRCGGQGFYVGEDVCKCCSGAMFVEKTSADSYNPDVYGGICCPRCEGSGYEYDGEKCKFCLGKKLVLTDRASSYDADDFDEVRCPRCNGDGWLFSGHKCELCDGAGMVLACVSKNYDPDDYELVLCRICKGEGRMNISGRPKCGCCDGNGWTTQANIDNYDFTEYNLQSCPRCDGRGFLWDGSGCEFCDGDGLVSDEKMETYDETQFDYPCPLCAEEKKYDGEVCPLCGGESRISYDTLQKYNEGYFWD